jgi:hypothetical protein
MLQIDSRLMIRSPSLAVSVVYNSDQLPKKELPLENLHYHLTRKEWLFVPNTLFIFPKDPRPIPTCTEPIADEVTSVEKSPSAAPGNDPSEQSPSYEDVVNISRHPVIINSSQSANITNSKSVSD